MPRRETDGGNEASDRETIVSAVRDGLRGTRQRFRSLASAAPHAPPPYVHPPLEDLVAQFANELGRLEGQVCRCPNAEIALDAIRRILTRERADAVIAWDDAQVGLPGLGALLASLGVRRLPDNAREPATLDHSAGSVSASTSHEASHPAAQRKAALERLAHAQVGITGVDAAIAESGTLLITGGAGRGRLGSLLTPVHIAVAAKSQIVRGLGEALARLRAQYGSNLMSDRSTLTCITGPSRTADIELTLTLGVHGPRALHVIIMEP